MSKSSYLTANVDVTSDSFGGWIGKTNLVINDMGTVVVTVGNVLQPNNSNGAETTGNAHIEGIFSTSTLAAGTALRGGTVSVPATLVVSSNANFTSTNGTINVTSSINTFNIDANNSIISSNVVFDGGITKKILIDVANTTVNTGSLYVNSNTYLNGVNTYITSTELKSTSNTILTGSRLDIDGTIVDVTSNTVFTSATLNANVVAVTIGNVGTNTLAVNSQADFNANVNIDGIFTVTNNSTFSGALVNITSANTTVGDAATDKLNVNAVSDFNANVNIDGILTQTANAVFTGGAITASSNTTLTGSRLDIDGTIVDVTSNTVFTSGTLNANVVAVTIGNIGTNTLVVNSQADFNANVNIDGILTQTANATFSGAETYFDNNVTLGASVVDTVSILGYVDADVLPLSITVDLGSDAKPFGNVHTTFVYADTDVEAAGQMVLKGAGAKTLRVLSADALYPSLNVLLSTNVNANTLVMVANTTGIHAGANTTYDLGSVATNWNKLYVKDAAVANSAVVSNVLTVNAQANTASLMVRDLTVNRVVYAGTGGELVDSANLSFNGSTLAVTGSTTISANLSVTNVVSAANVAASGHVGTSTLGTSGLATLNSLNVTNVATFNANVDLQDSDYLLIGTDDDLQIYHDGLNSYIRDIGVGSLVVTGSQFEVKSSAITPENMIVAVENAGVTLYHDNIERIATSVGGANVTGTLGVSALSTLDSVNVTNALTVTGTSTLGGNTSFSQNANVAGTLGVVGLSTLSAANLTNNLQVIGTSALVGNTTFSQNATINGNLTVIGTTNLATDSNFTVNNAVSTTSTVNSLLTVTGNTVLGDAAADIVTINATVNTNIIPTTNNLYNIGSAVNKYNNVYATNLVGALPFASITSKPAPVVTVNLSGDVTGSGSVTLTDLTSGTIAIATTVAPNSVALGADTTGNYMSGALSGAGIVVAHTPGEGSSATISHSDTSAVANLAIDNGLGVVLQDLAVTFDTFGHVQTISSISVDLDNRYDNYQSWTIQDGAIGVYTITSGDTLQIAEGTGIDSAFTADDVLTITNVDRGSAQNIFKNVAVSGQSTVVADTNNDTLTIAGSGTVSVTTDALTDTVTVIGAPTNLAINPGTTLGPEITSSTGSNSVIPSASGTASGIVTTTTQSFAGAKTFTSTIVGSINGNAATATTTTGNAATATKLATARNIGGVSFDGTLDINLPGVNAAGNQSTTGNAATATYATAANDLRATSGGILVIDGAAQALAVNYLQVVAANTAQDVLITTAGSDANVDLLVQTKGAGSIILDTGTGAGFLELKPGSSNLRLWDNTSTNYHQIATGTMVANRTLTLPDANVTLVSGTMVPTTGTGATGTWGISVTGNAATATKLAATKNIGGVAFDGTIDINLPGVNAAGNQNTTGNATTATTTTGNAATATKLLTSRTIGGVAFDGTLDINLPGVNTAGNQNTTGNATTATTTTGNAATATFATAAADLRATSGGILVIDGTTQASGVNYLQVVAAATLQDVLITTAGLDTNVDLLVQTKGAGSIILDTGTGAGLLEFKPGSTNLRIWDNTSTNYHQIITGDPTATRSLTLSTTGDTTLVAGTMVPTTGTGASGTWGISITGNAATATSYTGSGASITALNGTNITTGTVADARIATTIARTTTDIIAGNGLSGGGSIAADRTITMGTPGSTSITSTNAVTATSHTHALTNSFVGIGQTWQDVSASRLSDNTSYRNTTGRPIQVNILYNGDFNSATFQVSTNNSTWLTIFTESGDAKPGAMSGVIIPDDHYYRSITSGGTADPGWYELR
jgi:hypothetical protein